MLKSGDIIKKGGAYGDALKALREGKNLSVFDARFFEKTFFAAALDGVVLYVCADAVQAREVYSQIKGLKKAVYLPPAGDGLTYKKLTSAASDPERLKALSDIASGGDCVVVTSLAALVQRYPKRERYIADAFTLSKGEEYDLMQVRESLVSLGYRAVPMPESAGQFSSRGDILDIWVTGAEHAVRAEFFGDELESLREVDGVTYLSSREIDSAEISPATDVFYEERQAKAAIEELTRVAKSERELAIAADVGIKLAAKSNDMSLGYLRPFFDNVSLAEFVRPDFVVYDDAKQVYDTAKAFYSEQKQRLDALLSAGETMGFVARSISGEDEIYPDAVSVAFHRINSNNRIFSPQAVFTFDGTDVPDYSRDFLTLAADLKGWRGRYRVDIMCGNAEAVRNIGGFLSDNGIGFAEGGGEINLLSEHLDRGGIFHSARRVVVGTYDISSRRARAAVRRRKNAVFTVPEVGDYVVHETHGIGLCKSVEKLDLTGSPRDYLVLEYVGGDKLYVPVENMDSLSRYVSGGEKPKLSKLGGADFERVKSKVRASVKALAFDLLKLYAERSVSKGFKYSADDSLLEEFCADFPFSETEDQLTAVAEGLGDLKSGKIMDRLLCGDVGYGKTEVALRLAFKVISCGKQVAFVSPTTILACQHFETAVKRMERFGVRVERLTRFDSAAKVKETLARLERGETDLVCGTHRVLGKDVKFKDLGLLVLDEEQRFGVADKEKLKLLKPNVNVLSLSATPIPRTLYMTMVSVRDISVLDTPPADRIPVQTFVAEYSDALVFDAVMREINRGGQVFIVYNRVSGIDSYAARLKELMPDVRFSVAHGQMPEAKLERTVSEFVAGGSDVLVASTIIENGIDMPRANTLVVVEADKLGLAQLYQLRGRVGRSSRLAYAYFTYDNGRIMSETAYKRLEAITRYTDFGSGFRIAMADLEIRGAGTLLGREQHGHMEKVGYDMYAKLLADAVAETEGKPVEIRREVRLNIDFPAFLPESFVESGEKRMALYSRIAVVSSLEEKAALSAELADMYGRLPKEAENLLWAALVKNLAAAIGASSVSIRGEKCRIIYEKAMDIPEEVAALVRADSCCLLSFSPSARIEVSGKGRLMNFLLKTTQKRGLND